MAAAPRTAAIAALLAGATAIATSALWVKVSEAGPVSTAFWRVAIALPFLALWMALERNRPAVANPARERRLLLITGFFFAGDLAVWHWSIVLTSVANSTLLANLAPIFVTLTAWLFFRRMPSGRFLAGLALAIAGSALLIGGSVNLQESALLGDALGVVTAMFYAGYQLAVKRARETTSTAKLMFASGVVTAVLLLPIAWLSGEQLLPLTMHGWWILIGLALVSQVGGQSLIAYALAHLPATFSSVALLFQPVMATLFAWVLFGEALTSTAIAGGIMVLIGIRIAHQAEIAR
ncbi:MAG: DMT family transporter [Burkholderiales bacterium]